MQEKNVAYPWHMHGRAGVRLPGWRTLRVRLLAVRVLTGSTQDLPRRGVSARSRKDILPMHLDRDEKGT